MAEPNRDTNMINIVFVIRVFAFLTIGIFLWMYFAFQLKPKEHLKGFISPHIALQLAKSHKEFVRIAGDKDASNRTIIRKSLSDDYFFIAAYWLLFVSMGVLLVRSTVSGVFWLSIAVGICTTAAAALDVLENIRISNVLPLTLTENDDPLIHAIRNVSLAKWMLLFTTVTLLAPIFLCRNDWIMWVGYLFVFVTVIGFVGLLYNPAIEWASILMGVCMMMAAGLFACCSTKF